MQTSHYWSKPGRLSSAGLALLSVVLTLLTFTLLIGGCSLAQKSKVSGQSFEGRIVFNQFEGGFYGIITQNGKRLNPSNLPTDFRRAGLRVRGCYRQIPNRVTLQMWGQLVEFLHIEVLEQKTD